MRILKSLAIALVIAALPAQADDVSDSAVQRIVALSNRSQQFEPGCVSFFKSLKESTHDSKKREFYFSLSSSLAFLNKADQYPGSPVATGEAIDTFLALDKLPKGAEALDLQQALASLNTCHSVEFYGYLTRLIHPLTQSRLTSGEKAKSKNVILAYIRHGASEQATFPFQTSLLIELLTRGSHIGFFQISAQGMTDLGELRRRLQKVRTEGVDSDNPSLESTFNQFEEAESVRSDFQNFL
jgi:hypothetical protein